MTEALWVISADFCWSHHLVIKGHQTQAGWFLNYYHYSELSFRMLALVFSFEGVCDPFIAVLLFLKWLSGSQLSGSFFLNCSAMEACWNRLTGSIFPLVQQQVAVLLMKRRAHGCKIIGSSSIHQTPPVMFLKVSGGSHSNLLCPCICCILY